MEIERAVEGSSWDAVLALLPTGYEESARELGALIRRREVKSAGDLLRLALTYSVCDLSLRMTAAWAAAEGLGSLSDVAVLKRLRAASEWLGWLVLHSLWEHEGTGEMPRLTVRILDASVVSEPGARGTDWRVHLGLDLVRETIRSVEVTGPEGGESLWRHGVVPDEILVVDRGYAHRKGVAHVLERKGHVVVRLNWQNFPLEDEDGHPIDLLALVESLPVGGVGDFDVWFRHQGHRYAVRLVARRNTSEPTERDVRRVRCQARKKKRKGDPRTLRASCFVILLTDMSRGVLPPDEVLDLYRLRWRIETAFKQFKSLLHLDSLRAHDPKLVATYIHGKLLAAILMEALSPEPGSFPPCGGAGESDARAEPLADPAVAAEGAPASSGTGHRLVPHSGGDPADTAHLARRTAEAPASLPSRLPPAPICPTLS